MSAPPPAKRRPGTSLMSLMLLTALATDIQATNHPGSDALAVIGLGVAVLAVLLGAGLLMNRRREGANRELIITFSAALVALLAGFLAVVLVAGGWWLWKRRRSRSELAKGVAK